MINNILKLDNKLKLTLNKGYSFCFFLSLVGAFMLALYQTQSHDLILFFIGYNILKYSIIFFVEFIVCGAIVDYIFK